jgi:hypothetical protein
MNGHGNRAPGHAWLAALLLGLLLPGTASAGSGEKMLYLNLIMIDGKIRLDTISVLPGKSGWGRFADEDLAQEIVYRVEAEDGSVLLKGQMEDPSLIRIEDAGAGLAALQAAKEDTVHFSLRLPYRGEFRKMNFFRRLLKSKGLMKQGAGEDIPIGTIAFPACLPGEASHE